MPLGKNLKKDTLIPSEKKEEKKEVATKKVAAKKTEVKATAKKKPAKKAAPKVKAASKPAKVKKTPAKAEKKPEVKAVEEPILTPGQLAAQAMEEIEMREAQEKAEKAKEVKVVEPEEEQEEPVDIVPAVAPYEKEQTMATVKAEQDREVIRKKIGTVKYLTEEEYQEKKRLKAKFDEEVKAYSGQEIQLIVFKMGGEKYAIEIDRIKEVVPTPRISKIPHAPDFIKGVSNVRGTIMVVLDLGQKFRIDTTDHLKEFILVIQSQEFKAGILVDEVPLTLKVPGNNIVSSSGLLRNTSLDETYIKGIIKSGEDMIIFIDIVELVQEDEVSIISQSLLG